MGVLGGSQQAMLSELNKKLKLAAVVLIRILSGILHYLSCGTTKLVWSDCRWHTADPSPAEFPSKLSEVVPTLPM